MMFYLLQLADPDLVAPGQEVTVYGYGSVEYDRYWTHEGIGYTDAKHDKIAETSAFEDNWGGEDGAEGGTRTHTPRKVADFKSAASTVPPPRHVGMITKNRATLPMSERGAVGIQVFLW